MDDTRCNRCNKVFKTKKSKTRHIHKQICVSKDEKTYCNLCDYTADNKTDYRKHLLSISHLSKISNIKTKSVEIQHPTDLFTLDPYLTTNEKRSIHNNFDTAYLTLNHKNNTISKIDIKQEKERLETIKKAEDAVKRQAEAERLKAEKEAEAAKYINGVHYVVEPENNLDYQSILNAELFTVPPKTERQQRIINFLIKAQTVDDTIKKEKLKQILRLVNMEDANYLMSHIRKCDDINLQAKQFYMNFIDKFIMELIKLVNNGIEYIGDKKIVLFIEKLSK